MVNLFFFFPLISPFLLPPPVFSFFLLSRVPRRRMLWHHRSPCYFLFGSLSSHFSRNLRALFFPLPLFPLLVFSRVCALLERFLVLPSLFRFSTPGPVIFFPWTSSYSLALVCLLLIFWVEQSPGFPSSFLTPAARKSRRGSVASSDRIPPDVNTESPHTNSLPIFLLREKTALFLLFDSF